MYLPRLNRFMYKIKKVRKGTAFILYTQYERAFFDEFLRKLGNFLRIIKNPLIKCRRFRLSSLYSTSED